jgi:hypothetical protein
MVLPFPVLAITDSSQIHKQVTEIFVQAKCAPNDTLGPIPSYGRHPKIRLAYFSADLHNHATAYLMAELFEKHDRERFELYAFSFGPDKLDDMRVRVMAAFDHFIDIRGMTDQKAAELARELEIDIAIDLKGFTQDGRTDIFAYRTAPIQISYLGYPGTMGASYFEYLVADHTIIPPEAQQYYSEKIIYLPDSYQVNDRQRAISDKVFTKAQLGLPEEGFVFCCFNNNYKILPQTFDIWMRLLQQVEGSVLWLFEANPTAMTNLKKEAQKRGIHPERLVFAKWMPPAEHLARQRLADLFIDTLPYNAHTTASDALWAGLPVLTLIGQSFASRVAASLLNAIGLPELITHSEQEYEQKALELANNSKQLVQIKAKLAANRLTTPLFDTERFRKNLEQAYLEVYERHQAGLPVGHVG